MLPRTCDSHAAQTQRRDVVGWSDLRGYGWHVCWYFLTFIYVCLAQCMCGSQWKNLRLYSLFLPCGSQDRTWVIRLGSRCFCLLSHTLGCLDHFLAFGGLLLTEAPDDLLASQRLTGFFLIAVSFIYLVTFTPPTPFLSTCSAVVPPSGLIPSKYSTQTEELAFLVP